MFNKTRTIIITFVAALSVVSAAPMVSVTSAANTHSAQILPVQPSQGDQC